MSGAALLSGGQAEQTLVVAVALQRAGAARQQRFGGLLRLLPLQEPHLLRHLLNLDLVALAQQRQLLAVALLDRREQRGAEAAHLAAQLQRLLNQQQRSAPGRSAGSGR